MSTNTPAGSATGTDLDLDKLKPGHCHKCGLPLVDNPHPEAGKPEHYLDVGCPKECLPCTVGSRHKWASRAMKAEGQLADLARLAPLPSADRAPADGAGEQLQAFARNLAAAQKPLPADAAAILDANAWNLYQSDDDDSAPTTAPAEGAGEQQCWSDSVPCKKCGQAGWHVCTATAGDSPSPQPEKYSQFGNSEHTAPTSPKPVGEIVAGDPVHGWHVKALKPWNEIGEGTLLYAGLPPRVTQSMVNRQNEIIGQLEASRARIDALRAKYAIPQPGVDEAAIYVYGVDGTFIREGTQFDYAKPGKYVPVEQARAALTRRAPPADLSATSLQPLCSDGATKSGQQGAAQAQAGEYCCADHDPDDEDSCKFWQSFTKGLETCLRCGVERAAMAAPAQRNGGDQ